MAGDWIKLEHATLDKPEILELSELLSLSHGDALLYCLRVWVWADQQSRDGHGLRVTKTGVDALMRCPGFANALIHVGWLSGKDGALSFNNFDRHNGKTSKERALATKRKQSERSRSQRDESVTREEKRREEKREVLTPCADALDWLPPEWQEYLRHRSEKRVGFTATARKGCIEKLRKWREAGHDIAAVLRNAIDNGYTGLFLPTRGNGSRPTVTSGNVAAAQEFVRRGQTEDENETPTS